MRVPVRRRIIAIVFLTLVVGGVPDALADSVTLNPDRDNTIYDENGSTSNGAGDHLFAGRTNQGRLRRGLVRFDVAGAIPAGSSVTSVSLQMYCSKVAPGSPAQTIRLHRLLSDWGAAGSEGAFEEGRGAPSQIGDATWTVPRFGVPGSWGSPGGDFAALSSATQSVLSPGVFYTWSGTAQIVADVQGWVDGTTANHGWAILGNEVTLRTVRRFGSGDHSFDGFWPELTVEFDAPGGAAGAVPNGGTVPGTPLRIARGTGGQIDLTWDASCSGQDDDFAVYVSAVSTFAAATPVTCSTGGTTTLSLTPPAGAGSYLVVPSRSASAEGSYGLDSGGGQRAQGGGACFAQNLSPDCGGAL